MSPTLLSPMITNLRNYIWPMDVDSLFLPTESGNIPFLSLLNNAFDLSKWEFEEASILYKPVYENYRILQEDSAQMGLLEYFRNYELIAGIRFTFRDMLSLLAKLFYCNSYDKTIKSNERIVNSKSFKEKFEALHELYAQLYYIKIFPWELDKKESESLLKYFKNLKTSERWANDDYSALECLKTILKPRANSEGSYIERVIFSEQFKELDPAKSLNDLKIPGTNFKFSDIDQYFSRGINIGLENLSNLLTPFDRNYILMIKEVEEFSLNGEDLDRTKFNQLSLCISFFRKYAALICKRSIGLRYNLINHSEAASKFLSAFYDQESLQEIKEEVSKALFPDGKLKVSFCSSIGQPSESLFGDACLNLGSLGEPEGLIREQYENLPSWDILFLKFVKNKSQVDVLLNFTIYLKVLKLAKLHVMEGCIPPDFLIWKDNISSGLSSREIRDTTKLVRKEIELTNKTKIKILSNGKFDAKLV